MNGKLLVCISVICFYHQLSYTTRAGDVAKQVIEAPSSGNKVTRAQPLFKDQGANDTKKKHSKTKKRAALRNTIEKRVREFYEDEDI